MSFPTSPADQQIATVGGYNYQYSFATNTWTRLYSGIANSSLTLSATTDSTGSSSGALIVTGGAGIGANLYVAGNVNAAAFRYSNGQIATTRHTTSSTPPANPNVGDFWYCTQNDTMLRYTYDGGGYYWVDITSPTFSNFSPSTTSIANAAYGINTVANGALSITGNLIPSSNVTYSLGSSAYQYANLYTANIFVAGLANVAGVVYISNTSPASSTVSGALQVSGGAAVQGTVYTGSSLTAGASSANYLTLAGQTTGNNPTITAVGSDTNIGITLAVKNTGNVVASGNLSVTGSGYFSGVYNENSTLAGVFIGNTGSGTPSPRIGFYNGNVSQNWQIDNNAGEFRWFVPGSTKLTLYPSGNLNVTGGYTVSGKKAVNGPAFSAYANNSAQTITTGSQQKVLFQTEEFDTDNCYTNSRFTPTVEGYYQLNAEVRLDGATGTGEMMIVIWRNGSEHKRGTNQSGTQIASNFWAMTVSSLVYANGTTDYFEIYVQQGFGGNVTVTAVGSPNITWFNGAMVRGA